MARAVVVGAGIGGLVAALDLAVRGLDVVVLERAAAPGGKLREVLAGGQPVDSGPTVFTLRPVFEEIFANAGSTLAAHLRLQPASVLARHAWSETERLDLFADPARSEAAIGAFAGAAEARGFRAFCARARAVWRTLETPFVRAAAPTKLSLLRAAGLRDLWRTAPFATLWSALGEHFADPRLRQLFGRYATYVGSSPFLAPATLMLIAHVEQDGVWLVEGGMQRIAEALAALARRHGATIRCSAEAAEIEAAGGRVSAVRLAGGERIAADAVVFNGDAAALAAGLLGDAARSKARPAARSLSAITWSMHAQARGFPLLRHNVFFTRDYAAEFTALFGAGRLPAGPSVYICAQDRAADEAVPPPHGPERLLCLVNAPPTDCTQAEIAACETATFRLLNSCGLTLASRPDPAVRTAPQDFAHLFPASRGALYGAAVHGANASFRRPGARTALAGLYLAGGSTHPGAGLPMAALSGRLAAASLIADLASTAPRRRAATRGGISMPSATTGSTR